MFSTIKSRLPWKRSNKLAIDGFVLDVVASIMHNNAICWDVHVSGHSEPLYDQPVSVSVAA